MPSSKQILTIVLALFSAYTAFNYSGLAPSSVSDSHTGPIEDHHREMFKNWMAKHQKTY